MLGRRSLQPEIQPLDPKIEWTIRIIRARIIDRNHETDPPCPLREYFTLSSYTYSQCIQVPPIEATQYEIKSSIIQMLPSFYGHSNEDPYKYLDEFLEIYSTIKIQNLFDDAFKLKLFSLSLKDKAKYWLHSLDSLAIST